MTLPTQTAVHHEVSWFAIGGTHEPAPGWRLAFPSLSHKFHQPRRDRGVHTERHRPGNPAPRCCDFLDDRLTDEVMILALATRWGDFFGGRVTRAPPSGTPRRAAGRNI